MEDDAEHAANVTNGQPEPLTWPDVPRLCFGAGPKEHLNACVGWVQSRPNDLSAYVEGYQKAARALYETALKSEMSPDFVVFPLAFLWRHHVELALKDLIGTGRLLEGKNWSFPDGHKLWDLWTTAKPYVLRCGSKDAPEIKNVEQNIKEFERIDPYADGFRYPLKKDGSARSMPNAPEHVNLELLHNSMMALGNFFTGVRWELSSQLEYVQEQEAEAQREMECEYRRSYLGQY